MPTPEWLRPRRSKLDASAEAAQWEKCPKCGELLYRRDLAANQWVCTRCDYHFRMRARDRLATILDGDFVEIGEDVAPSDPLGWVDKRPYREKLAADREKSGLSEAIVAGFGTIDGLAVGVGVMDFSFRGGTMGTVVGERVALLLEAAAARRVPCVIFTASGGARMEEGMLALMQMANTTAAVERFARCGRPFVTVLTDPTTGGVSASFAFEADVIVAEAHAAIGFAGRRVIEQTVRQRLPENFQTAEFLLEKGHVDMVVARRDLRPTLARLLAYMIERAPLRVPAPPDSVATVAMP